MRSFVQIVRDGSHYKEVWPLRKELALLFAENRVITATQLGVKVMPPLALLMFGLQIHLLGPDAIALAMACALFFLSLPVQGYYWLGVRSVQPLQPALARWYRHLHDDMCAKGHKLSPAVPQPRYYELAQLLRQAFKLMDKPLDQL